MLPILLPMEALSFPNLRSMIDFSTNPSPARILERLQMRFGVFSTLATASLRIDEIGWDVCPPMDVAVALSILEFGADLDAARLALEPAATMEDPGVQPG